MPVLVVVEPCFRVESLPGITECGSTQASTLAKWGVGVAVDYSTRAIAGGNNRAFAVVMQIGLVIAAVEFDENFIQPSAINILFLYCSGTIILGDHPHPGIKVAGLGATNVFLVLAPHRVIDVARNDGAIIRFNELILRVIGKGEDPIIGQAAVVVIGDAVTCHRRILVHAVGRAIGDGATRCRMPHVSTVIHCLTGQLMDAVEAVREFHRRAGEGLNQRFHVVVELEAIVGLNTVLIGQLSPARELVVLELERESSRTIQLDSGQTVDLVKDPLDII